jgi:hypothetical protein
MVVGPAEALSKVQSLPDAAIDVLSDSLIRQILGHVVRVIGVVLTALVVLASLGTLFLKVVYTRTNRGSRRAEAMTLLGGLIELLHRVVTIGLVVYAAYMLVVDVFVYREFDVRRLIVLNIAYAALVLLFSIFKMCILTIWANYANRLPKCTRFTLFDATRIRSSTTSSRPSQNTRARVLKSRGHCSQNTYRWLDSNVPKATIVLVINLAYLFRVAVQGKRLNHA